MKPLQYEDRYHNLVVSLEGTEVTTVDVHRYQNNDAKLKSNDFLGNREALKKKDALLGKVDETIRKEKKLAAEKPTQKEIDALTPITDKDSLIREVGAAKAAEIIAKERAIAKEIVKSQHAVAAAVHLTVAEVLRQFRPTLMTVHSGKGSPEEIAQVLHLVATYKLYDKKFATAAAGVKDYCDKYIGLDCNGFVGNYARATGKGKVPNTPIGSYAPVGSRRSKLEDVKEDDVLVWTDNGHIAVIHSIDPVSTGPDGKPARDCIVVESTAGNPSKGIKTEHGGLQHSTYSIRSVGADKVFLVERPKGSSKSRVYIAPLT